MKFVSEDGRNVVIVGAGGSEDDFTYEEYLESTTPLDAITLTLKYLQRTVLSLGCNLIDPAELNTKVLLDKKHKMEAQEEDPL